MNVTCPECRTSYRVDPAKIPVRGVIAQCARCPGEFIVDGSDERALSVRASETAAAAEFVEPDGDAAFAAADVPVIASGWDEGAYRTMTDSEVEPLELDGSADVDVPDVSSAGDAVAEQSDDGQVGGNQRAEDASSAGWSFQAAADRQQDEVDAGSGVEAADEQAWEDDGAPPTSDSEPTPGLVTEREDQWEGSWRRTDVEGHDQDVAAIGDVGDESAEGDSEGSEDLDIATSGTDDGWSSSAHSPEAEVDDSSPSDDDVRESSEDRIELVGVGYDADGGNDADRGDLDGVGETATASVAMSDGESDAVSEAASEQDDESAQAPLDETLDAAEPAPEPVEAGDLRETEEAAVLAGFSAAPSNQTGAVDLPPPPFGSTDPDARARRLARALVSDIVVYHPDRRERSLKDGTLRQEFREEIRKSWDEYVAHVGDQIARDTTYFRDALNDLLAGGSRLF